MAAISVEIDDTLLRRAQEYATSRGYSSFSAFLESMIQERLAQEPDPASAREAARKFEELGYIDAGLDI